MLLFYIFLFQFLNFLQQYLHYYLTILLCTERIFLVGLKVS